MQRLVTDRVDRLLGTPPREWIGFMFGGVTDGALGLGGPRETAFGCSGAGCPVSLASPDADLSMDVTLTKMSRALPGQGPTDMICDLIRSELGVDLAGHPSPAPKGFLMQKVYLLLSATALCLAAACGGEGADPEPNGGDAGDSGETVTSPTATP